MTPEDTMNASRRRLPTIAICLSIASMAIAGCGSSTQPEASAKSVEGWSQAHAGTTLNVIAEATANSGIIQDQLPDFEKKTGIKVKLEQAPYDSLVQKAVLDFTTKKGAYDVLSIPYEYLGSFAENKYLREMDDFVATPPAGVGDGYASSDIVPGLWEASSKWKDHWYGAPSNSAVMMMLYRKDLLESKAEQDAFQAKYGYALAPAKTWAQYRDIAEFFTRDKGDQVDGKASSEPLFGAAMAGKRHVSTVLEWMNYSWTYGGDLFDSSGKPALNSPANVAALEYEKELTDFAPPGYTSATWDEITASLQQGSVAQSITWGDTAGAMEDQASSKVKGKVGYASIPTAKEGDTPEAHLGSWTYVVSANARNAEASELFVAWALSKPVQLKLAKQGGLPALTSAFEDATLKSELPYWEQELISLNEAKSRPRIPQWSGIADVLSLQLSRALSGQASPQAALDDGQDKLEQLMDGALPVTYQ
jgi:multiple sugar transport system substrate-binding protein